MGTKLFLVSIVIVSSAAAAYGYNVGFTNGAVYFIGGPPATSSNSIAVGTQQVGGYVNQHAEAFNPGGISAVGQSATPQAASCPAPAARHRASAEVSRRASS